MTADDGHGGLAQQTFTIDAVNRPPVVTQRTPDQAGSSGNPSSVDAGRAFGDPDAGDKLAYSATGLPPGLSIDPNTGQISGTPTAGAARSQPYQVTVTATDADGASASETFAWTIQSVSPSILPLPRNIPPVYFDVEAPPTFATTDDVVLDAINLTTGNQEQSVVIQAQEIVLSTVDNAQPLERQQPLDTPGAGIVRSGAATDEKGDRFGRTQSALDEGLGGFSTSSYVGSSLRDTSLLTGRGTTTLNLETMVRDGVLTLSFDNASRVACVVPVARYQITLADGEPLPIWLHATGKGVVSGKVPPGVQVIDIKVRATLTNGIVIERIVSIRADNGSIEFAAPVMQKNAGLSFSDMIADARDTKVARTGLAHLL